MAHLCILTGVLCAEGPMQSAGSTDVRTGPSDAKIAILRMTNNQIEVKMVAESREPADDVLAPDTLPHETLPLP
jgi:hypothetical protein